MGFKTGHAVLLVLAVGMLGWLIYAGRQQPLPEDFQLQYFRLFPYIETAAEIVGMELVIPAEESGVAVVVEEDQTTWRLRYEPFSQVDPIQPQRARDFLGLMEGFQTVNRGETTLESFGLLPNPQYVIRFQLEDFNVVELWIGNKTASGAAYYVSLGQNSAIVNLVESFWIDEFVASMLSLEPAEATADITPTPTP